jgi:hypothetical protein
LRSRKGRGGQQHEAKVCHDKLKSPEKFLKRQTKLLAGRRVGATINSQPLGRIVAAIKCDLFLFPSINARMRHSFTVHSGA